MAQHKSLEDRIRAKAAELGFVACGFARADAAPRTGERLRQWLAEGCHGSMLWMEGRADQRASPAGLWPDVRSIIALGMSYAPAVDPLALAEQGDVGRISVYAQGADYHDVVKKALKALGRWLFAEAGGELKVFVDTAPVMEKPLSEAAGLGWQGKHTNLVSRDHGSWLFLGAIYTTLDLSGDRAGRDRCGSCDACQRACPTDAFPAPYRIDARRCISYWTIEHDGPIPEDIRTGMGNRIYGCDDCLAVCPWNKFAQSAAANRAFRPRAELVAPLLAELLALDDAGFRQVFAGSPIKRIGRNRMVRNCLIAAGNSGDGALAPVVERLLADDDAVVRDAAHWALARIAGSAGAFGGDARSAFDKEVDMTVEHSKPGIEQARAEIAEAIEDAGLQHRDDDPEAPAKVIKAPGGLSVEVRYNGTSIALDGNEINEMPRADFRAFLQKHKLAVEAGEHDAVIERALANDGPDKAVVRVRALD